MTKNSERAIDAKLTRRAFVGAAAATAAVGLAGCAPVATDEAPAKDEDLPVTGEDPYANAEIFYSTCCDDEDGNPSNVEDGKQVRVAGVITQKRDLTTKSHKQMCFMTIEDRTGKLDVTVFPQAYEAYGPKLKEGVALIVIGNVEHSDFGCKVICNSIQFLEPEPEVQACTPSENA